ncbi:hypothetical protein ACEWPM_007345 [Roseovarius sp. S4756]|uniref:hypothetical protein n=1 Tax=Roseovarius maritimus TaxID=3342637 RepID=UPI00372B6794
MHTNLATRRRVLLIMYQRYMVADRTWNLAQREMKTWFPAKNQTKSWTIGSPRSQMRRLFEERRRALLQLDAARVKLRTGKQRLSKQRQRPAMTTLRYLTCTGTGPQNG